MADIKWIKITTDIFDDEKFSMIDAMPDADAIELIWFKLLVFAGKSNNNGLFFFNDRIAYTDEMLSSVFHRPLNTVRLALKTFIDLGMIEEIDGVYTITNWGKHQSLDSYEKKKIRDKEYSKKYREKQKLAIEEKKSSDESSDDSRFCSYSISNSNINNYLYILNTDYKNVNYINNNKRLDAGIRTWLTYKDEKKPKKQNHYDTKKSLEACIDKIVNYDKEYGTDTVLMLIDDSIVNEWQGIIFNNAERYKNKKYLGDIGKDTTEEPPKRRKREDY